MVRGKASPARAAAMPKRLMARLEALEDGTLAQIAVETQRRVVRTYFGIGLAGAGILGCIALLVLPMLHPHRLSLGTAQALPGVGLSASPHVLPAAHVAVRGPAVSVAGARMPDETQPLALVTAPLSTGDLVVRPSALPVAAPLAAPRPWDVKVTSGSNIGAEARAPRRPTLQASAVDPRPQAAPLPDIGPLAGPTRPRPEGASALGALPHQPSVETRQIWWKMPMPDWAPFPEAPSRARAVN